MTFQIMRNFVSTIEQTMTITGHAIDILYMGHASSEFDLSSNITQKSRQ
jgi:hypothetical protein